MYDVDETRDEMRAIWKLRRASFPFNLRGERERERERGGDVRTRAVLTEGVATAELN